MTSATVTVLYEDSRAPAQSFALHELVVAIVADRTARPESERWRLVRVIVSLPCNGNAKLRREAERLVKIGLRPEQHVIAVYDDDRVRGLVGVASDACKRDVLAQLPSSTSVASVLFVRNMETVLEKIREGTDLDVPDDTYRKALAKDRGARDEVFRKARAHRPTRERLYAELPSLRRLVDRIAEVVLSAT